MSKKILILLLFIGTFFNYAQDEESIETLENDILYTSNNSEKIKLLEKLWTKTAYDNEDKALNYAKEAVELGRELKNDTLLAKAYERLGISYANISNYKASNLNYELAIELNKSLKINDRVSGLLINKGQNYQNVGQLDSALVYINKSKDYIDLTCCKNDSIVYISYLDAKSSIYLSKGQYNLALEYSTIALELNKLLQREIPYADLLLIIADANESLKNSDLAVEYFKEALEIYLKNDDLYFASDTYRRLGTTFSNIKPLQKDSVSFYLTKAIKMTRDIKVKSLEVMALIDYATFLIEIDELDEAKYNLKDAKVIAEYIDDTFGLSDIAYLYGKAYHKEKNYNLAIPELEKAIELKSEMGLLSGLAGATGILSEVQYALGNFEKAYTNAQKFKSLSDSLYNKDRTSKFNELQIQFDTEKKNARLALQYEEIKSLNVQKENVQLTKTIYGIGMFSFIAIASLLYFGFKQRIRKNKIEREKQEAIYKQEIEFKKKELTSQTLHLVKKNTFIQELKENLEKIKQSPELFKVEFRRLVLLLKKRMQKIKTGKFLNLTFLKFTITLMIN